MSSADEATRDTADQRDRSRSRSPRTRTAPVGPVGVSGHASAPSQAGASGHAVPVLLPGANAAIVPASVAPAPAPAPDLLAMVPAPVAPAPPAMAVPVPRPMPMPAAPPPVPRVAMPKAKAAAAAATVLAPHNLGPPPSLWHVPSPVATAAAKVAKLAAAHKPLDSFRFFPATITERQVKSQGRTVTTTEDQQSTLGSWQGPPWHTLAVSWTGTTTAKWFCRSAPKGPGICCVETEHIRRTTYHYDTNLVRKALNPPAHPPPRVPGWGPPPGPPGPPGPSGSSSSDESIGSTTDADTDDSPPPAPLGDKKDGHNDPDNSGGGCGAIPWSCTDKL